MLDEAIAKIREVFSGSPFEGKLYLVGGLIRDRLLGVPPEQDIDLVCLCDALEAARWLRDTGVADHSPVVYPRFGTAMVTVLGVQVELATARRESYAPGSRKPERVEPATLEEDVLRRDFTVNTLGEDLFTGERLDLTGRALPDLEARLIRTPLEPRETFNDDPLRMLRAVRFAARLDFEIEQDTWSAIRECAARLEIVSRERIRDELTRTLMLAPGRASRGLGLMLESGLLRQFAPELAEMAGVQQNVFHLYDVWTHTLKAIESLPEDSSLDERLAMLLHDVGKPRTRSVDASGGVHFYGHQQVGAEMARDLLQRLKFPNQTVTRVTRLVERHMRIGEYSDEWSDSAVRRLIRDLGDDLDSLFTIAEADRAACNPEYHYLDPARVRVRIRQVQEEADYARVQSPLDGVEIMRIAGLRPGPDVGRLKDYLVNEILEGRLAEGDRQAAERLLREKLEREHGRQRS